ncbi:MAG: sigma 54-interacting transcriptional regulator [Desulfobacterales bacterium]|nr:sigma 54-interacting transcriptional regulator [Desulfobacterales bacterium]
MLNSLKKAFSTYLDKIPSGVLLCDSECKIIYLNQFYAQVLGVSKAEALETDIRKYFPRSEVPKILKDGKTQIRQKPIHYREIAAKNSHINLLVNRYPVWEKEAIVGVVLITIPFDYRQVTDLISRVNSLEETVKKTQQNLNRLLSPTYTFDSIVGENAALIQAKKMSEKYAFSDASVLILGPTGSGKELFAHAIHAHGPRQTNPFVCVNCAALPKELLESELFGYEEGAFTGARKSGKSGKIQMADNGTLFLDEIGDLPLSAQAKLLRVLEGKNVERLGSAKLTRVNFRLICATNCDLQEMMKQHRFRDDLFYRINALTLTVPPLSNRSEDIPLIISSMLHSRGKDHIRISENASKLLRQYPWPGNIRELRGVIERAVTICENNVVEVNHLSPEIINFNPIRGAIAPLNLRSLAQEMAAHEKFLLGQALLCTKGKKNNAAKLLGVSRTTFYEKCKRFGLGE